MLGEGSVVAMIAVKDLDKAKEFYTDLLNLNQVYENAGGMTYECGGGNLFVYKSPMAGANKSTCAWWGVEDCDATVEELRRKGVKFEHFDIPGARYEGDIHVIGIMRTAWFKDPDGNILGVGLCS
jgi:catechol 2,3-dioxygenase-like lactoylglutathione lyase family enzyme